MKTIKIVTLVLVLLFISIGLDSTHLRNVRVELKQPDGVVVIAFYSGWQAPRIEGGVHLGYVRYHDKDNFTIIKDQNTGYFCWARQGSDGRLESSGFRIDRYEPRHLNIEPGEDNSPQRRGELLDEQRKLQENNKRTNSLKTRFSPYAPTIGNINQLVIFIRFQSEPEFTTQSSYYDEMFNGFAPGQNSLKRYFYDTSYEKLTIDSHFFPLSMSGSVVSFQAPHERSYYTPFCDSTNVIGYDPTKDIYLGYSLERNQRKIELLRSAINFVSAQIDSTLNVDSNDNGFVDNINFIIKGLSDDWGTLLYPHQSNAITSDSLFINDKKVYSYNFYIEDFINTNSVGVLAHEFAHSMGIPDLYLYHDDYRDNHTPVGEWDLMAHDLNPPQSMSAYVKYRYTEWMDGKNFYDIPRIDISVDGTYNIKPLMSYTPGDTVAVKFQTPDMNSNEYIVIENRAKPSAPAIDSNLPSSGLLIYRVRADAVEGNSKSLPYISGAPFEMYIYRPGGDFVRAGKPNAGGYIDGNISNATFPTNGKAQFTDYTNPIAFLSNGDISGITIKNIRDADLNDGSIAFDHLLTIPELYISHTSMYGLQQAIDMIQHNGKIVFLPRFKFPVYPWDVTYYYIYEPISSYGKAFTIENLFDEYGPGSMFEPVYIKFLQPATFHKLAGPLVIRDVYVHFSSTVNINETDIILDTADFGISNSVISTFSGNADDPNSINFSGNSQLWIMGNSTVNVTDYYIDTGKITVTANATFNYTAPSPIPNPFEEDENEFPEVLTNSMWNYPNPFNPETTIAFTVTEATTVKIDIFNIKGQKVNALVNDNYVEGKHTVIWNGRDSNGQGVGSGIYLYRMTTDNFTTTKKMILMK
jgi:M6 family metalloprotease-like protein